MQINLDYNTEAYTIRSYDDGEIIVSIPASMITAEDNTEQYQDLMSERKIPTRTFRSSLIITADEIVEDWAPSLPGDLNSDHMSQVMELRPEIVLLGTGSRIQFPPQHLTLPFLKQRIGVEVMDNAAACRTYNFLTADGRRVAAALIIA